MSEEVTLSSEFIRQVCATYQMNEALMAGAEMSEEPSAEFIANITRIIAHLDNTMGMLKRIQSVSKQAEMVMKEHQV